MTERVEMDVDAGTARWLRDCAGMRGATMGAAAAAQLRALALADSAARHDRYFEDHPGYLDDAHAEQQTALAEAGLS